LPIVITLVALVLALCAAIPAAAGAAGSITGTVRGPGGETVGEYGVCVQASSEGAGTGGSGFTQTGADGRYRLDNLTPGYYRVVFRDCGMSAEPYASQYYSGKRGHADADLVVVREAGTTDGIDVTMEAGTSISGTVRGPEGDAGVQGVCATAAIPSSGGGWTTAGSMITDSDGRYKVSGLAADVDYRLEFRPCQGDSELLAEWFDDAATFTQATAVRPTVERPVTGTDARLAVGASISGTIRDAAGRPIANEACASASSTDVSQSNTGTAIAGENGQYRVRGLAPGSYRVRFYDCVESSDRNDVPQYYGGTSEYSQATLVVLGAGGSKAGIDATLREGVTIAGTVTGGQEAEAIGDMCVEATPPPPAPPTPGEPGPPVDAGEQAFGTARTRPDGTYTLRRIPERAGGYVVRFSDCSGTTRYVAEYHGGDWRLSSAKVVRPRVGTPVVGVDGQLDEGATITGRITDAEGPVARGVCVAASRIDETNGTGAYGANSWTLGPDGTYAIGGLPAGGYRVTAADCFSETERNDVTNARPAPVQVAIGETAGGIDFAMRKGTTISGTVYDGPGTTRPLAQICVTAYDEEGDLALSATQASTTADGRYAIRRLDPEKAYTVGFYDCSYPSRGFAFEYFGGGADRASATILRPTVAAPSTGIDVHLAPPTVRITSGPAAGVATNATTAVFGLSTGGAELALECAIDTGDYAPCRDTFRTGQLADGSHAFSVRVVGSATPALTRTWTVRAASPNSTSQGSVPSGGTFVSDPDVAPSSTVPVVTAVRLPQAGTVTLTKEPATTPSRNGYTVFGQQFDITATSADGTGLVSGTPSAPIRLTFAIATSAVPAGINPARLTVLRNGAPAADCTTADGSAVPDPCVAGRSVQSDGSVTVSVLTTHLSVWNLATTPVPASGDTGGGNPGGGDTGGGNPGGGGPGPAPGGGTGPTTGGGSAPGGGPGASGGTPGPGGAPAPASAPTAKLGRLPALRIAKALRGGVRLPVTCSTACRLTSVATIDGRTARRLGLAKRAKVTTVATGSGSATAKTGLVLLRFSAKAKRTLRRQASLRLTVTITVKGTDGATRKVTRTLALRR
jgi:hypothetical protein